MHARAHCVDNAAVTYSAQQAYTLQSNHWCTSGGVPDLLAMFTPDALHDVNGEHDVLEMDAIHNCNASDAWSAIFNGLAFLCATGAIVSWRFISTSRLDVELDEVARQR